MPRRVLVVVVTILAILPLVASQAASQPLQVAPPITPVPPPSPSVLSIWLPSTELLAQASGALVGFGVFSLLVAPQAAALGGITGFFEGRVAASAFVGAGAVAGTYVYDLCARRPFEVAYFWHRSGFVAGIAFGLTLFGVLGYPGGDPVTWTGWTVNRAAVIAAGLGGAWLVDRWYRNE